MTLALRPGLDVGWRVAARLEADTPPLTLGRLHLLPAAVRRPRYDVSSLRPGVLHLGCGAFHRAHQAVFTQRAIEAATGRRAVPPPWGIVSVNLRSDGVLPALARQDGLFSVVERGPRGAVAEVVGAVRESLHATRDAARLREVLLDPGLQVVTLTVTESGYCADLATGRLDGRDAAVSGDLDGQGVRCVPGLLVEALARRRAAGLAPPVLLSCDNIPGNGRLLRQVCIDFAALHDDALAGWIARHVQFPSTMVDRIVPACTPADRRRAERLLGLRDDAAVTTEPFRQWVIERFDGPRPAWEAAGAEFVDDVAPWEASKLRLLNGGHLALACLGLLAGCETVADAMGRPLLAEYALRLLVDEQRPTLPRSDHDIHAYAHQLVARWRNPGIAHGLARVARNASGKLPTRLLAGLRCQLAAGRPAPLTLLAVAAWIWCASGRDARGRVLLDEDQRAPQLQHLGAASGGDPGALVRAFLGVRDVFGDDLPRHDGVVAALAEAVHRLQRRGALGAVDLALRGAA